MKHQTKTTFKEQAQQVAKQDTELGGAREFASVEEMLRHDAVQTPVPPTVAQKLADSLRELPNPNRTWWQRLLGR